MIVIMVAFFAVLGCLSVYGIAVSIRWNNAKAAGAWAIALVSQIAWAVCVISHVE